MDHNMAAVDQINLLCRQLSVRLNEQIAKATALETSVHLRLLKIEQTLGLAQGAVVAPLPAPLPTSVRAPSVPAVRPGQPKPSRLPAVDGVAPEAVIDMKPPGPDLGNQLLDLVRALSPATADSILAALATAAPAPATPLEPEAWLAAEQPGSPPIVEVATSHVDH